MLDPTADQLADPAWWQAHALEMMQACENIDDAMECGRKALGFAVADSLDFRIDPELQADALLAAYLYTEESLTIFTRARANSLAVGMRKLLDRLEAAAVVLALHYGEYVAQPVGRLLWRSAMRNRRFGVSPNAALFVVPDESPAAFGSLGGVVQVFDQDNRLLGTEEIWLAPGELDDEPHSAA